MGSEIATDEREALSDPRVAEYLVTHADALVALDWAAIEPCAAGGFKVWASAATERCRYGHVEAFPYWRPDAESARLAAWDTALALLADWDGEYKAKGFAIQAIDDRGDLLAEVPIPATRKAGAR